MPDYFSPEWRVANSGRAYPLSEAAARVDDRAGVTIPDSLLLDARVNALPVYAAGTIFVSRLDVFATTLAITLGFAPADGTDPRTIATIAVPANHADGDAYFFEGGGPDASVTGCVVVGDLSDTRARLTGNYHFGPAATPLEVSVLSFGVESVRYLELLNGADSVGLFPDTLRLVAGRNVRFTRTGTTDVRVDVVDGLNTTTPDECEGFTPGPCIRTINGVGPDAQGNFQLEGSDCISVEPATAGLSIADTCARSCCGCDELAVLMAGLQDLRAQEEFLRQQLNVVQAAVQGMVGNLVAGVL